MPDHTRAAVPSGAPLRRPWACGVGFTVLLLACAEPEHGAAVAVPPWGSPAFPQHNPPSRLVVELGASLFFDVRLSGANTLACASCHDPARAFTDGVALSTAGASGRALPRNAPGLLNIGYAPALFWDGGSANLESLTFGPIINPDEMDQDPQALLVELRADPQLVAAFAAAFPGEALDGSTLMRALAQYQRSLISASSPWDLAHAGGAALPVLAQQGEAVFQRACASCHVPPLFTDHQFHNQGLDGERMLEGAVPALGRARITRDPADLQKYRTPSLRNLGYTAPYMHDGRFAAVADVLAHYRHGVRASSTLDPRLRGANALGVALTDAEAAALLAFL